MPGDLFPTVELNSFSVGRGPPKQSGQDHLYLFGILPTRHLDCSFGLFKVSPTTQRVGHDSINAEPGAIDAERWQKFLRLASFCVSTVRSLFDPSSNLYSGLQVTELPLLLHIGSNGMIKAAEWKAPAQVPAM